MFNNTNTTANSNASNTTTTTTTTSTATTTNSDERVFNINLVKGQKKWNIAKFSTKIDIAGFSKPVKMYKFNPMTQIAQEDQKAAAEAAALAGIPQKPFKRKYEAKPVNAKTIPWRLEDSQGNNTFQGTVEGNQSSSNYFLFMFQSDGTIKAVPCTDWYNFRPKKELQTLTTEEAEDFMKKKYQEWDFLTSRVKKNQEGEKSSGGSGGGSGGGGGGGSKKPKDDDDDEDSELRRNIYEDPNKFKSYGVVKTETKPTKKPTRKREENYNEEDGDAPDFEGKFDDDDDDTYMDDEAVDESHPHLQDEEEDESELNSTGLEMQKMLKNIQKKEEQSDEESADEENKQDEEEDDDDDDDDDDEDLDADFSITSNGTKSEISVKEEPGSNSGPPSPSNSGNKKKKTSTTTTTTSSKSNGSPPKSDKKSNGSSSSNITGKKNKSSESSNDTRDTKKIKKEPSSPPPPTSSPSVSAGGIGGNGGTEGPLTEDDIRKVILREKKIKSIDLINTFRNHLKDPTNKKEFLAIVGRIARVIIENNIKYIIPK